MSHDWLLMVTSKSIYRR